MRGSNEVTVITAHSSKISFFPLLEVLLRSVVWVFPFLQSPRPEQHAPFRLVVAIENSGHGSLLKLAYQVIATQMQQLGIKPVWVHSLLA